MQGIDNRIRERMDTLAVSVNALAETSAIPRMTLTRRLTDPATLTLSEVDRIAEALSVSSLYLMTGRRTSGDAHLGGVA